MPHPKGERLRCDECGAEIVYMKACNCPLKEPKTHSNICCGKEMQNAGTFAGSTDSEQQAG